MNCIHSGVSNVTDADSKTLRAAWHVFPEPTCRRNHNDFKRKSYNAYILTRHGIILRHRALVWRPSASMFALAAEFNCCFVGSPLEKYEQNSLTPWILRRFFSKTMFFDCIWSLAHLKFHFYISCRESVWWWLNTGSSNGLVSFRWQPLPEPICILGQQVHLFMHEHEKRKPWRVIIPSKYQLKMIYTGCWLLLPWHSHGLSQMVLFLPLLYSFVVIAANRVLKSTRIFHNDISHLCNEMGYDISIMIRLT